MTDSKFIIRLAISVLLVFAFVCPLPAQSPFSDNDVKVEKSSANAISLESQPANSKQSDKKTSFFARLGNFIKNGVKKLVDTVKNRNKPGKLPSYINRAIKIPGHETAEFVFQGICPLPKRTTLSAAKEEAFYRHLILSYYPKTDKTDQPSQLIVIDSLTGKPVRRFALYLAEGKPYTGHAGGITAAGKFLWVASGYKLHGFDLQQLISFVADKSAKAPAKLPEGLPKSFDLPATQLVMTQYYTVDSSASYVSFDGKYIWVGDFVKTSDSKYEPIPHHDDNDYDLKTWIAGYVVDQNGKPLSSKSYQFTNNGKTYTGHKPDRLIFCRQSVQGFAFVGDYVALSISYGAKSSKLAFYKNPTSRKSFSHSFTPAGQKESFTADAWVVDGKTHLTTIKLPAGSEDLEFDGHVLYVGFEGASPNYRPRWTKINPLLKIEDRFYLISPKKISELNQ